MTRKPLILVISLALWDFTNAIDTNKSSSHVLQHNKTPALSLLSVDSDTADSSSTEPAATPPACDSVVLGLYAGDTIPSAPATSSLSFCTKFNQIESCCTPATENTIKHYFKMIELDYGEVYEFESIKNINKGLPMYLLQKSIDNGSSKADKDYSSIYKEYIEDWKAIISHTTTLEQIFHSSEYLQCQNDVMKFFKNVACSACQVNFDADYLNSDKNEIHITSASCDAIQSSCDAFFTQYQTEKNKLLSFLCDITDKWEEKSQQIRVQFEQDVLAEIQAQLKDSQDITKVAVYDNGQIHQLEVLESSIVPALVPVAPVDPQTESTSTVPEESKSEDPPAVTQEGETADLASGAETGSTSPEATSTIMESAKPTEGSTDSPVEGAGDVTSPETVTSDGSSTTEEKEPSAETVKTDPEVTASKEQTADAPATTEATTQEEAQADAAEEDPSKKASADASEASKTGSAEAEGEEEGEAAEEGKSEKEKSENSEKSEKEDNNAEEKSNQQEEESGEKAAFIEQGRPAAKARRISHHDHKTISLLQIKAQADGDINEYIDSKVDSLKKRCKAISSNDSSIDSENKICSAYLKKLRPNFFRDSMLGLQQQIIDVISLMESLSVSPEKENMMQQNMKSIIEKTYRDVDKNVRIQKNAIQRELEKNDNFSFLQQMSLAPKPLLSTEKVFMEVYSRQTASIDVSFVDSDGSKEDEKLLEIENASTGECLSKQYCMDVNSAGSYFAISLTTMFFAILSVFSFLSL